MMQISTYGQSQGTLTGHIFSADERHDQDGELLKSSKLKTCFKSVQDSMFKHGLYEKSLLHGPSLPSTGASSPVPAAP